MRLLVVKLPFRLTYPLLLQTSIELAASCYVRPVFASNELLSVLDPGDWGRDGRLRGGNNTSKKVSTQAWGFG
jgi:hypothetical protein